MEQKNEQLQQTLIKQYSQLAHTSEIALSNQLKNADWWNKEQKRLNLIKIISSIGGVFVVSSLCFIVIITLTKFSNNSFFNTLPLISFIGAIFGLGVTLRTQSRIQEQIRLFELLKLLFSNNSTNNTI